MKSGTIELFKAGDYPQGVYTEKELDEIVSSYDPSLHEAPLVIGHKENDERAKTGEPAHGWFKRIFRDGMSIFGEPIQISDALKNDYQSGRFKKWSVELYPRSKSPVPGKYYLKCLSFLGAASPQVKGLRQAIFKEDFGESICIIQEGRMGGEPLTKEDLDRHTDTMMDKIKSFFGGGNGKKFSDDPSDDDDIESALDDATESEIEDVVSAVLSHPKAQDVLAKIEKEADEAHMAELEKNPDRKFRIDATKKGISDWIESMIKAKKLSPKVKDAGLGRFMELIAFSNEDNSAIKFAEAGPEITPVDFFKKVIEENILPSFQERAKNETDDKGGKAPELMNIKMGEHDESGRPIEFSQMDIAEEAARIADEKKISVADATVLAYRKINQKK